MGQRRPWSPHQEPEGGEEGGSSRQRNGRVIQPHSHYATLCYLVFTRRFLCVNGVFLGCAVEEHRFVEIHRWGLWKKKETRGWFTRQEGEEHISIILQRVCCLWLR